MIFVEAEVAKLLVGKNSWPQRIISYPPPLEATYINRGVHILQTVASTTDRNNGQVAVGKVWGRCGQHTCVRVARERQPRWEDTASSKIWYEPEPDTHQPFSNKALRPLSPRWSPDTLTHAAMPLLQHFAAALLAKPHQIFAIERNLVETSPNPPLQV